MPQPPVKAPRLARPQRAGIDFRRQYDDLELRRSALAARLKGLGRRARTHPGYKRALVLLNDIFRKSPIAQRRAVLDAAGWLIGSLEQLTAPTRPLADIRNRQPPG